MLTFSLVVLIYVILGLLEVDDAAAKLRAPGSGEFGRVLLAGGSETAVKLRRYMLVRTQMSVMTGLLVWAFAAAVGLPLAAEWGVIAFALNYIPFIGPFIATLFPTLFAIAQFESWQMAVIVFACLNLIQFVVGSYIEPRIAGRALAMSPFLVLFAVFFWTFLWGIAGAFIGVPIVIAALTLCEQHPSSRWIADLLGGPKGRT
jgi:predicted PurR-regulated permease PerM